MDSQQPQPGAETQAARLSKGKLAESEKSVGECEEEMEDAGRRNSVFVLQTVNMNGQVGKHFQVSLLVVITRRRFGELLAFSQLGKLLPTERKPVGPQAGAKQQSFRQCS